MKIKNPLHPEEITAAWINFALRAGGVLKKSAVKNVKREVLGGGRGFLSSVIRASLDYDVEDKDAPKSVVVKIEPESETFHRFGDELNAFQREIRFYKEVASNVRVVAEV